MKKRFHITFTKSDKNISRFFSLFLCFILSINLSGQKIYWMLGETWTSGNWQNSSLTTNTYDGSGYQTKSLTQTWDVPSLSWKNSSQTNYTNNPDGTANQTIIQSWDGISAWTNLIRSTYTYTPSKKVATTVGEIWLVSIWMTSSMKTNTYDGSGYLTNTLNQSFTPPSTWTNSSQTNYTNNPDGTVNQWINQTWVGGVWTNSQRSTFTYTSGKILTLVADLYTAGNWVPQTKLTYTYASGTGYLTNELSQLWDVGSSTWKDNTRDNYINNPDGTAYQVVTQKWDGVSVWNNTDRLTFGYSQLTGLSELIKEEDFTIYPNPASDIITIKANKTILGSNYFFTDQTGKMILKGKITNENMIIDITQLTNGIYFLHFGERSQHAYKVIKNQSK